MQAVSNPILLQFEKMVEFLGHALGPDYEVALHDLTSKDRSIIAIANNHISGRGVGGPLSNLTLGILRDRQYETSDYVVHHYGVSVNGKDLRSCTFFIKDAGQLVGLLCINFDDSRYREISDRLLGLCHPDLFVQDVLPAPRGTQDTTAGLSGDAIARNGADAATLEAINRELAHLGVSAKRLTSEERLKIITALEGNGIFLVKGAVKIVASCLHCSPASVYRYLAQIKNSDKAE